MARRSRIVSCAKGHNGCINRRIDSVVEIVGCNAITSQMSDCVCRNGYRDYSHTAPIELTSSLKEHFGRRVVHIIDTSDVENQTMNGLFRSGDEVKNLLDYLYLVRTPIRFVRRLVHPDSATTLQLASAAVDLPSAR